MSELADILILLDDIRYSSCNTNMLIVGIPNGVLQYFRETKNAESVANRIQEIQKVSGLDADQVKEIVKKGFDQLRILITDTSLTEISTHVWAVKISRFRELTATASVTYKRGLVKQMWIAVKGLFEPKFALRNSEYTMNKHD